MQPRSLRFAIPGPVLALALAVLFAAPAAVAQEGLTGMVQALNAPGFDGKIRAVEEIAASGHPRAHTVLRDLLEGRLFFRVSDRRVVAAEKAEGGYAIEDVVTGEELGTATRWEVRRVVVNNRMRSAVRGALARMQLASPDPDIRLAAVQEMTGSLDGAGAALLEARLAEEENRRVREALRTALALARLGHEDAAVRLEAIDVLEGSVEQAVRNRLHALADGDADPEVRAASTAALKTIEGRLALYDGIETLFFGLSLGSVLALAAIGLAITFGVMGVINMAHGELIMLGAYTTYVIQLLMPEHIGVSLFVAIPAAFLVAGIFGVIIERTVIRFLYGRPLETLLATFGISLILQQLVRTVFSPLNRSVATPEWMSGSLQIDSALSFTYNRLYIIVFTLLVFAALFVVLKRTRLGLQVRAVAQNRAMAKAMGVRSEWVDAMTFGLGSGIAGVAGVALSQLTNVGPNLGQAYIIDSFMVVVFGGVGNLLGTLVAGMSLGVANKLLEPEVGAVMAKILILVFIIIFIQKRPRGLFPQRGRAGG